MTKIFVAGHNGMVGRAICRLLKKDTAIQIITRDRNDLDLCNQRAVFDFMQSVQPNEVILAAAKVGGIYANSTYPAEFIYENLQIQNNVIHAAHLNDVQKLLFLGSSCIYPRHATQPMNENALLTGRLEPTNEPYALAKIAGIKMCESYNRQYNRDYRSVMPTNLYGPGDNYHPENSHVVPALIRRFHEAKESGFEQVTIWGSGRPMREFLYVDDMAAASLHIHNLDRSVYTSHTDNMATHINVGTGEEISIKSLAREIKKVVGFEGQVLFDTSKPDGAPRKLLDVRLINKLGWRANVKLEDGLSKAYQDFVCDV